MKNVFKTNVREISEIAIMSALAIVMDRFVKIPSGITGGSINICAIPLFVVSYRHGWFKGFLASGIVFGLITCLFDGYGMQTYPFEYLIAFGSIGIAGLFGKTIFRLASSNEIKNKIYSGLLVVLTVLIFFVIRTLFASFDSMIFWELTFAGALAYNLPYVGLSAGGVAIFLLILLPIFTEINKMYKTNYLEEDNDEE